MQAYRVAPDLCGPETALRRVRVVGIGGGSRDGSLTEIALRVALKETERLGAVTSCFAGETLSRLPIYRTDVPLTEEAQALVAAVRQADGVIIATPGYHGGISGMVKNALDILEETRADQRPYLDGRSVGCIVTGFGWQTCGTTLSGVRSIVHALRGWPTPLAAALNVSDNPFDAEGSCVDTKARQQLETVGRQVVAFGRAEIAA